MRACILVSTKESMKIRKLQILGFINLMEDTKNQLKIY